MHSSKHRLITKEEIEKVLYDIGFIKVTIRLAMKTNDGQEELVCYKYNEIHCLISFVQHPSTSGIQKDWVLIEYANNIDEASKWMFEDGDMIPLDLPIEQIVHEMKDEVLKVINSENK